MRMFVKVESLDIADTEKHRAKVLANIEEILREAIRVQLKPQGDYTYADFKVEEVSTTVTGS